MRCCTVLLEIYEDSRTKTWSDISPPKRVYFKAVVNNAVGFRTKKVIEYDQEIPQSKTTDQPTTP